MSLWLEVARVAAGMNLVLLGVLGAVWARGYRQHGATHTLGLLIFTAFLLVENGLWLYFYLIHPDFINWFINAGPTMQAGITGLCGLELVALLALVRITWW